MPNYSDVHKAVLVEKTRIWMAYVSGLILLAIIFFLTKEIAIVGVIAQVLLLAYAVLFFITSVRMTRALNRKDDAARREALEDQ